MDRVTLTEEYVAKGAHVGALLHEAPALSA